MSEVAIRVEGLGKKYRIGARQLQQRTLRDSVVASATRLGRFLVPAATRVSRGADQDEFWALQDVAFEVRHGQVLGIIGRNGAGKSTLLKLLSRITEPTAGHICISGRVASLLEVGTGFHPELTGRENVYLNGAILGMSRAEVGRRFDEIVAFAEVERFIDTQVKRYSSGMYLRLAFAVAAHLEPEILIVDEVLAVGDAAFQSKCLGKMGEVSRGGRTVLLVSHNTSAILALASRCLLLQAGRVVAEGRPRDTVMRYLAPSKGKVSIGQIPSSSRRGAGDVRFTDLTISTAAGEELDHVISGSACYMHLAYTSNRKQDLPNCRVSIGVTDALNQPLFVCSTELIFDSELRLPPTGTITCCIPRLPLSRGEYLLSLFFEVNREVQDWLESSIPLTVSDGTFFKGAKQYPAGYDGVGVLVAHDWTVS